MAGIGFELRKLLERETLLGTMEAYVYAGVISSGPWILSILGILAIGLLSLGAAHADIQVAQFQVSVTYIIVFSLIYTGTVQLAFTRFTADRIFEHRDEAILPNFLGLLLLVSVLAAVLASVTVAHFFAGQGLWYRQLMVTGFVVMSDIWVASIFLSGIKQYKAVLLVFALGYAVTVALSLHWQTRQLEGLLAGFVLGQALLLLGLVGLVLFSYPSRRWLGFAFLRPANLYPSLVCVGLFYNMGVWLDKLMFWFNPDTGESVIGPLRASPIYDTPVFLAYLSIIPGMAVFLVRLETEFVEYYHRFYDAVRLGGSLNHMEDMRNEMVASARQGIQQIVAVQTVTTLIVFVAGSRILEWIGISQLYLPLLYVNLIAASLQVVFLGVLNIFFYLDKRREVLLLTAMFAVINGILTAITLELGPKFYGYGFAAALGVAVIAGIWLLDRRLESLEYETFMHQ
jgi:uncharacterized membrane protein